MSRISQALIAAVLVITAVSAQDLGIFVLRDVPKSLSDAEKANLNQELLKLASRRQSVVDAGDKFIGDCPPQLKGSQGEADCKIKQGLFLEKKGAYNTAAQAYNDRVFSLLEARVNELKAELARDTQAVRNLNVHSNETEFKEWATVVENADEKLQKQVEDAVRDFAMSIALGTLQHYAELAVTARPLPKLMRVPTARKIVQDLKAAGIDDPALFSSIMGLSSPSNQGRIAAGIDVVRRLAGSKTIWDLRDAGPDTTSAKWSAASAVVAFLAPDPKMMVIGTFTLNEIRVVMYTVSTMAQEQWALHEINELTALNEQQLVDLKRLSTHLKDVGTKLRLAKAELAAMQ